MAQHILTTLRQAALLYFQDRSRTWAKDAVQFQTERFNASISKNHTIDVLIAISAKNDFSGVGWRRVNQLFAAE
jgi:hypothetical protein